MKFKKFISVTLSLALVGTSLVSCGGSDASSDGTDVSSEAAGDEEVTLRWALWDLDATPYYEVLGDAYMEQNPNVNIEYVDLGSADYSTMLSTQLSGGADLDILTIKDIPGYSNLIKQNRLEPLNDFVEQEGIDTSMYGGTTEQITKDGELYALPFRSDFWVVFYNKALFDAAGVPYPTNDMTLAEYDQIAREMTSGEGADKVYGCHYHTWRSAVQLFGILDGEHTLIDGEYEFLKPYYEAILQEQEDGICQDYATLKTSSTHYSGPFYKNQVAMMNMGTWFITSQIDKVKTGESLSTDWGIVKYPHPEGVEPGTTIGTITSLAVNTDSDNKEEALDFVEFATSEEGAELIAETGAIPAIQSDQVVETIASMDGFPQDENSKEALTASQMYLELPLDDNVADIEIILNEAHDDIMTGNLTIDEGIQKMDDRVAELLAQ